MHLSVARSIPGRRYTAIYSICYVLRLDSYTPQSNEPCLNHSRCVLLSLLAAGASPFHGLLMLMLWIKTTFAVPMTCEGCAKDISKSLSKVEGSILSIPWDNRAPRRIPFTWANPTYNLGIHKVEANVKDQIVLIEGTAPPSSIVAAIQSTGRDAILRGSGTTNSMSLCSFFVSGTMANDDQ